MVETKYEKVGPVEMALSAFAVEDALGQLNWDRPTLFVHPSLVGIGHLLAEHFSLNLAVHSGTTVTEWFIEWGGKYIGSDGC